MADMVFIHFHKLSYQCHVAFELFPVLMAKTAWKRL